jgi:hypothetical protein
MSKTAGKDRGYPKNHQIKTLKFQTEGVYKLKSSKSLSNKTFPLKVLQTNLSNRLFSKTLGLLQKYKCKPF